MLIIKYLYSLSGEQILCSFHFRYRKSGQVSASVVPENGISKRRQSILHMRVNWQYLTWKMSLGSTKARPSCHKGVGPGRLHYRSSTTSTRSKVTEHIGDKRVLSLLARLHISSLYSSKSRQDLSSMLSNMCSSS